MEQCQQDRAMLTEWKNLNTIQDTRKVASIEEFKNKKFRYQMSEYSVEIERLVVRLENLFVEGASLEPTLLERIRRHVERFPAMAEKMMQTKEFLVFKDHLIDYLRNFIKGLQRNVGAIDEELRLLPDEIKQQIFDKIVDYELSIPRMDVEISREKILEKTTGRYQSIYDWFVQENGQENEAAKLFDATNDIIRRITRYAAQISEKNAMGANRREEYRKVAELFMKCEDIREAHKMSAMVFGLEQPFHMKGDLIRESTEDKKEARKRILEKQREETEKLRALEQDGGMFWIEVRSRRNVYFIVKMEI